VILVCSFLQKTFDFMNEFNLFCAEFLVVTLIPVDISLFTHFKKHAGCLVAPLCIYDKLPRLAEMMPVSS